MSTGVARTVHFEGEGPIRESPTASQPPPQRSLWNLPGLDKNTFYAAALYLHAVAGDLKGKPWVRGPKTPEGTRNFLDRLADCFARSKLQDARDHVSATAMVRSEEEKKITLYIAKNQSTKGSPPLVPREELDKAENENILFADKLVRWFTDLARQDEDDDENSSVFRTMCNFTWSRLEHYIARIEESDIADLDGHVELMNLDSELQDGWEVAKSVMSECKLYQDAKSGLSESGDERLRLLTNYAELAGRTRKHLGFRNLTEKVESSPPESRLKRLAQVLKWINYLGRLHAAYVSFREFCRDPEQEGYSFSYYLLPSQEDVWTGDIYMQKIQSWSGELDLAAKRNVRKIVDGKPAFVEETVEAYMSEIIKSAEDAARVHCEMQLLMHFFRPNVDKCLDYFGCSKKSCWLCWQMMLQTSQYSMKDTHRKLYPRWAFPFDYHPSQPGVAEGLRTAYNDMLFLIQDKVINQRALTSLEPYPQSSARMTPGPGSAFLGDNDTDVREGDNFPAVIVPALYLPADSPKDLRHVRVWAYEFSDDIDYIPLSGMHFNNKRIVFAFQRKTKPKSLDSLSTIIDLEFHFWNSWSIPIHQWTRETNYQWTRDMNYKMYYRSAEDRLLPNPRVLSSWRDVHGEEYRSLPWRGDIFIVPFRLFFDIISGPVEEPLEDPSVIDSVVIFRELERMFQSHGAGFSMEEEKRSIERATLFFNKLQESKEHQNQMKRISKRFNFSID